MFTKKTIRDIDLKGKTVLLRADYNVPLDKSKITDDYRIRQSLNTINYLLQRVDKLVICSHLGRPEGQPMAEYSLSPVAKRLEQLSGHKVNFINDCIGKNVSKEQNKLAKGEILLLENLRFYPGEESNDKNFAKKLAEGKDIFVQDGFGVVHRAHASTEAITHLLPSVAGLLLEKEVDVITDIMEKPRHPLMAIIGGAKIADKLEILQRFIRIADFLVVGGALSNPFLVAEGHDIKESLYEKDELATAKHIIDLAEQESKKRAFVFTIPFDAVVSSNEDKSSHTRVVDFRSNSFADITYYPKRVPNSAIELMPGEKILDIGPFSASFMAGALQLSNTVVWNGTMGVTESNGLQGPIGPYAHGTETIIDAITGQFGHKPFSVVGGGDTVGYLEARKIIHSFNHVSTGGGASLELMSGHKLPGLEALQDKNKVQ